MLKFNIIVAVDEEYGIGKNGTIPWSHTSYGRNDMKNFKALTSKCDDKLPVLIMGKRTYNSCGKLPGRIKVMVSSTGDFTSLVDAISAYQDHPIWVCGGRDIYLEAFELSPAAIYVTKIPGAYGCDVKLPELQKYEHLYSFFVFEVT